jgi:anti-anti-sigma factor
MAVLTLCGELDLELAALARRQPRPRHGDVTLDCAGLTFMDAAGIHLFFEIDQECAARGAKLTVVNAPHCVTSLLTLVQLDDVFDIRPQAVA